MAQLNIPSVTLEDLRAFQAKHFPGQTQTHVPTSDYPAETTYDEDFEEEYVEEDDLGYYPDGVKRTLTDEQIRIFRHTEVHALLRERQLEKEALEAEERIAAANREYEAKTKPQTDVETQPPAQNAPSAPPLEDKKQKTSYSRPIPSASVESSSLDYDDDSGQGSNAVTASARFAGRRIISYDE